MIKEEERIFEGLVLSYETVTLKSELDGYSAGLRKDSHQVMDAFATVQADLRQVQMFHTNRGGESNNMIIDKVLDTFHIQRSLSL